MDYLCVTNNVGDSRDFNAPNTFFFYLGNLGYITPVSLDMNSYVTLYLDIPNFGFSAIKSPGKIPGNF
jgi:hypothetical protein